jgi:hypothetical protein
MPGRGTQQQSRAGEARSHGEQHSIGQTRPDDVGQRAPAQHGRGEEARAEASDGGVGPQRSLEVYGAPCLEAPLDDEAERAQPTQHEKLRLQAEAGTLSSGPPLAAGKAVERSGERGHDRQADEHGHVSGARATGKSHGDARDQEEAREASVREVEESSPGRRFPRGRGCVDRDVEHA